MPLDDTGFSDRIGPLDKIDRVIDLLAREECWCKGELVTADGRRCIMGAVQAVDGVEVLAPPILAAIRQVTGRRFLQIELFNDDPTTTHPLVLEVLLRARDNIIDGICCNPGASWWGRALNRLFALRSRSSQPSSRQAQYPGSKHPGIASIGYPSRGK